MNTVEASILLEEAIDLAAASPDDAVYARLLAFRDGWFREQRVNGPAAPISSFASNVGHYTAPSTATIEVTPGRRALVKAGDKLDVRIGRYTLGPVTINGAQLPPSVTVVEWKEA
jgi:hypothetical protein